MRTRVCAVRGCSKLIDSVSLAWYCATHDALNADLSAEYEDDARAALDSFLNSALNDIEFLKNDPKLAFDALAAEHIILHAPEVVRTAEAGETWTAVRHALWLGMWIGHSHGFGDRSRVRRMEPHANRGEKILAAAAKGGRRDRELKGPSPELLKAEIDDLLESGESATNARKRVAKKHGMSLSTVRRRIK